MTSKDKTNFMINTGVMYIRIPTDIRKDSSFHFKENDEIEITIVDDETLIIRKVN